MKRITKLLPLLGLLLFIGCSSEPYVELYFTEGSANVATGAYVTMEAVTAGEDNANLTFLWRKSSSDAYDTTYGTPFSPRYSYSSPGTYTIECWVYNGEWGSATQTITVTGSGGGGGGGGTAPTLPGPATPSGLPIHTNIKASTFWCGEGASDQNDFITNTSSAWDGSWGANFGLEDKPLLARDSRFIPTSGSYKKQENPYYFALPYDDFGNLAYDGSGSQQTTSTMNYGGDSRKTTVTSIPWAGSSSSWNGSQSMVKNRWIRVRVAGASNWVYAQWEDAGPYYYNDANYVFGTGRPANSTDAPYAGIDLSPSVCLALGQQLESWGAPTFEVDWQFVDASEVPSGPWTVYCTTRQTNW